MKLLNGTITPHSTLRYVLQRIFNMDTRHVLSDEGLNGYSMRLRNSKHRQNLTLIDIQGCGAFYDNHDFSASFRKRDETIIMDSPVAYHFWDYRLAVKNSKFILTTRDSHEYASKRIAKHGRDSPPMLPRPCGLSVQAFSREENALFHGLHQEFVRCIVPDSRLLDICIVCGNTTYGMLADFLGVDVPPKKKSGDFLPLVDPYPHRTKRLGKEKSRLKPHLHGGGGA
jgi:hypothetical protein